MEMGQEDLLALTENVINEYLQEGSIEGLSLLMDPDIVAYSHLNVNYVRGDWNVRQFLNRKYERLSPFSLNRCKMRCTMTGEGASVVARLILTCTKAKNLIFLNITVMYKFQEDDCPVITGIHIDRDYRHENTYRSVNQGKLNGVVADYLATYDELTGIYNKQAFYAKTKEMLLDNPDKNFDLLRINIERFKVLNDLFGESTGDKLLRYIGKFLKEINLPLCVSGRLYADNFVVCYEAGKGDSRRMINTLQMVADSFAINNRTILSFGLYRIDDKTLPVSVMCDRANMALWKAKGNFKNPYCEYDEKMRQQVLKEQKIINAMEMAIQNKEFTLYIQPKYDIEKGIIIGAEALVRWISQKNGFISPGDFIPVFENNGFVYEVDKFIWEESCRYLRKWLDEGREVHPISVNVSRIDLYDPKLVQHLVDLREKYQLPSQYLELEITESAYTEDPEQIITITRQLREAGFVILMDDFGTGYSSLNMLKDIQIDVLKLDMGFLKSSDHSAKGGNILTAILKMAESLKMQAIAEGVETKEQVEFLKSIGCKYVQGFYYSKPLPVDEFEKLI
ncbi:MAG: bifunctional diguanylate cyclase/phosphodiesterase [Anaerovibrio sp.]|nr:bifunctional diguanylate cyclase/phosphodiesterase [Veillonellaceae bacterium]MCI7266568.1 bifunctional diguanylate cyclase/phosphodiesterase [Veillonellaceae bacterium]MDD7656427.1 bifunctional diguanylate cyclase/phosphodiesterase [Veillonellaceae bacterium]MDY4485935.1 bifunctional diguanylate cyclase/phosphodiesterase [Anaerovibrio sp.]MDY5329578.1 bifunctional diguanylate cyclase/phosphodiesterase [Anaerovibrio sp.]